MKKIIILFLSLISISMCCLAQGTLQFNQVLLITTTTTQTVPAGKVWKVEQFLQQANFKFDYVNTPACSPGSSIGRFTGIIINGVTYYPKQFAISNTNANPVGLSGINGPLWLPAGTTVTLQCANDLLNIMEFNVQ